MKYFCGKLNKTQYHNVQCLLQKSFSSVLLDYDAISILDIIMKILYSCYILDISISLFAAFRGSLLNVMPS